MQATRRIAAAALLSVALSLGAVGVAGPAEAKIGNFDKTSNIGSVIDAKDTTWPTD